jgi:hypothetical protein
MKIKRLRESIVEPAQESENFYKNFPDHPL